MTIRISKLKKLLTAGAAAFLIAGSSSGAMAFCFSNDSLSNTSFTVRQMPEDAFKKTVRKTSEISKCNALPKKQREKCLDLKKKAKAWEDQAAEDFYAFVTDLPLVGDPIDKAAKYSREKFFAYGKWQKKVVDDAGKILDDVLKPLSTRFRQTVNADGTQCCSWKNRDCNPSGKKDGKIYFNMKYANISRVVKLGATDHMECTIDKNNPRGAVCRNGTIRSEMNWKCLDIAVSNYRNIKNGSNVVLHDCHGGPNQRWTHFTRSDKLINRVPGGNPICLDVAKWNKDNGANVHVWKCGKKQANQRWTVGKTATYPRVLKVRYPGKCLDNTGGSKKGGKVHSWDCNPKNVNQQWEFKVRADNYLEIKSRRSGMCLDVAAAKKSNGAKVIQWPCNGKAHQQWKIRGVKDGWFQLRARHSGKCLDLKGPYKANGTPFQQWDCKNVKNQSFRDAG